jgi:ElaB/YqjD/DUF883 family membrane-anchored ribosome-binding protein
MEHTGGDAEMTAGDGEVESHMHLHSGPADAHGNGRSRFDRLEDEARDRFADVRQRAAAFADGARERFSETVDRAESSFDERTGMVTSIRQHPLAAVGIAFSVGFVVAAASRATDRNWALERARRRLRGAIVSGMTGVLAHELRAIIGAEEGIGHLIESFLEVDDDYDG